MTRDKKEKSSGSRHRYVDEAERVSNKNVFKKG